MIQTANIYSGFFLISTINLNQVAITIISLIKNNKFYFEMPHLKEEREDASIHKNTKKYAILINIIIQHKQSKLFIY